MLALYLSTVTTRRKDFSSVLPYARGLGGQRVKLRRSGMWSCSLGYSPIWKSKPDSCRSYGAWRGFQEARCYTMSLLAELDRVRPAKMRPRRAQSGLFVDHSRLSKMFSIFVGLLETASKPERSRPHQYQI